MGWGGVGELCMVGRRECWGDRWGAQTARCAAYLIGVEWLELSDDCYFTSLLPPATCPPPPPRLHLCCCRSGSEAGRFYIVFDTNVFMDHSRMIK